MKFAWNDLIRLVPILASIVAPGVGTLASQLIAIGTAEVDRRMKAEGKTREEVLVEAQAQWEKNIAEAEALLKEGHG